MSLRPLWPLVLLALLYWEAPRIVPHSSKFARVAIGCTTALLLPYLVYASLYGAPRWSPELSTQITILAGLGYAGMFVGVLSASICFILDVKRRP
jgi:hypothetical protein